MSHLFSGHRWSFFSAALLLAGLVWLAVSAVPGSSMRPGTPAPQKGFLAPALVLPTSADTELALADFAGKPVLINFWASWCGPCQAEMDAIQRVFVDYQSDGFVVLAVNTTYQDTLPAALSFVHQKGLTFPILLDLTGDTSRSYQVRALPTSFFVGADGIIRSIVVGGPMSEALLRAQVEEMLAGAR